jgi:hypothetical protein
MAILSAAEFRELNLFVSVSEGNWWKRKQFKPDERLD